MEILNLYQALWQTCWRLRFVGLALQHVESADLILQVLTHLSADLLVLT